MLPVNPEPYPEAERDADDQTDLLHPYPPGIVHRLVRVLHQEQHMPNQIDQEVDQDSLSSMPDYLIIQIIFHGGKGQG